MTYYQQPQPGYAQPPPQQYGQPQGYAPQPMYAQPPPPAQITVIRASGPSQGQQQTPRKLPDCPCAERVDEVYKARCVYCVLVVWFAPFCCKEPVMQCTACKKIYPDVCYVPF